MLQIAFLRSCRPAGLWFGRITKWQFFIKIEGLLSGGSLPYYIKTRGTRGVDGGFPKIWDNDCYTILRPARKMLRWQRKRFLETKTCGTDVTFWAESIPHGFRGPLFIFLTMLRVDLFAFFQMLRRHLWLYTLHLPAPPPYLRTFATLGRCVMSLSRSGFWSQPLLLENTYSTLLSLSICIR